jgi:hypothetical protein
LNANIISNRVEIASLQTSPWIQAAWIAIPHLEKIHIGLFWHSVYSALNPGPMVHFLLEPGKGWIELQNT